MPSLAPRPAQAATDSVVAQLDNLIGSTDPLTRPKLSDALLELHSAWLQRDENPAHLIATFLQHRRRLAQHDYLLTHRFRRRLEKSYLVVIETPTGETTAPLNLVWSSFSKLRNHYHHRSFEDGAHDWQDITISIRATQ